MLYGPRRSLILGLLSSALVAPLFCVSLQDVDSNADGTVDFIDFLNFAVSYNQRVMENPAAASYDYDESGVVDFPDFLIFASFFGQSQGLVASVRWPPDSLLVGDVDTLRMSILTSSIGACDILAVSFTETPRSDDVNTRLSGIDITADSTIYIAELTAGEAGNFELTAFFGACGKTFSDTKMINIRSP